jgi:hypothetical protein
MFLNMSSRDAKKFLEKLDDNEKKLFDDILEIYQNKNKQENE